MAELNCRVVLLGGTGAMGAHLSKQLVELGCDVTVTTRSDHADRDHLHYLKGNAKDNAFLKRVMEEEGPWDVVVDFMVYQTAEFEKRASLLLQIPKQYIFISSARVYAPTEEVISEEMPRLLDVCRDVEYLKTDEYALAKARQEDILLRSGRNNWTIIRPGLTYNDRRMQLAIFELKEWIYRALDHNSIIFPREIGSVVTTMTHGKDVAAVISKLILNPDAYGEILNVNGGGSLTWREVLGVYKKTLDEVLQQDVRVCEVDGVAEITKHLHRYDQFRFARGISRRFSNAKVESITGPINYTSVEEGLTSSLYAYLNDLPALYIPFRFGAYMDRLSGEKTPLKRFDSSKHKIGYLLGRYGLLRI